MKSSSFSARAITVAMIFCAAGCGTIRMKYDAKVQTEDGRPAQLHYEKSYDLASYPYFCGLTAIFLGGACWMYLVMPTAGQSDAVINDGHAKLDQLLAGKGYEVITSRTSRKNWKGGDDTVYFDIPTATAAPRSAPTPPAPAPAQ